jgi:hypothetical protein
MSSTSEQELRDRLGGALDTIVPPAPPVTAVIRSGRAIKLRRRASAVAGLAAIVALAVTLPGVIGRAAEPPAQPSYRITVTPPPPVARGGVIGSGTINGHRWLVRLSGSKSGVDAGGPRLPYFTVTSTVVAGEPATFSRAGAGSWVALTGPVTASVTRLTVRLGNGTVLTLRPVRWQGQPWVALVAPSQVPIIGIVAWSRGGEIAHAVPFEDTVNDWLKPGASGPARATVTIGSGVAGGRPWRVQAHVGPWGRCLGDPDQGPGSVCVPGRGPLLGRGELAGMASCSPLSGTTFYEVTTAPGVRSVRLRQSDGTSRDFHPVAIGQNGVFAFTVPARVRLVGWTAYGVAGQVLGDGPGWSCP